MNRLEIADSCRTAEEVRMRARGVAVRRARMRPATQARRKPPDPDEITAVHLVDDVTPVLGAARLALIQAYPAPGISRIMQAVADHYGISLMGLATFKGRVTLPGMIAMYLCRMLTDHSSPEIGRRLGGRDDTTVLAAVHRVVGMMDRDPKLAEDVDAIRAKLRP